MSDWDDLGDDELRVRLMQRGCTSDEADVLLDGRDDIPDTRFVIDALLDGAAAEVEGP